MDEEILVVGENAANAVAEAVNGNTAEGIAEASSTATTAVTEVVNGNATEGITEVGKSAVQAVSDVMNGNAEEVWNTFWANYGEQITAFGKGILAAIIIIIIGWIIRKIAVKFVGGILSGRKIDISLANIIKRAVSCVICFFVALMLLDLCGINTASVLTVLGASALAIGIALKDTLSNIAAGIFLLCQHPYRTGDYVECAGAAGTIEEIGLFTTKLKTLDGLEIFVPNNSIMVAPITNYSSNPLRRGDVTVTVSYEDDLEKAIKRLQAEMKACEMVVEEPEVLVQEYAENGVVLDLRYWTKNEDYWNAYWYFNHQVKSVLAEEGISIPYPHRVVVAKNK